VVLYVQLISTKMQQKPHKFMTDKEIEISEVELKEILVYSCELCRN